MGIKLQEILDGRKQKCFADRHYLKHSLGDRGFNWWRRFWPSLSSKTHTLKYYGRDQGIIPKRHRSSLR